MRYVLGLDIGSTSVGWTVGNLDSHRIEDLGVRAFNAAEVPKTRESLAKPRREARLARRRLRRRRGRLDRAKQLFVRFGLLSSEQVEATFPEFVSKKTPPLDPWQLRADGLGHLLTNEEFARSLYHIAKRRGFKSNRKHEKPTGKVKKDDDEKMLAGVEGMRQKLAESDYRTIGEMIQREFEEAKSKGAAEYIPQSLRKRNTHGDYSHTAERGMLEDEIGILFETQRKLGNKLAAREFEQEFLAEAFGWQKPFASGDDILKKVGLCTFEGKNGERRAARACWTTERFDLLQKINNLEIVNIDNGDRRRLSEDERQTIEKMAYDQPRVDYKQIRNKLSLPDEARFAGCPLKYVKRKDGKLEEDKDCEKSVFRQLTAYHSFRKALSDAGLWEEVKEDGDLLDDLAFALTFYKTDEDIRACLVERGVSEPIMDAATTAPTFSTVTNISIKAMRNMMPHLEQGLKYDEAARAAGYSHYNPKGERERGLKLPVIERDQITNPVVFRAVTQARKVVNAIVKKYGPPTYVNIELARDIGNGPIRRAQIEKINNENKKAREEDETRFKECFNAPPKGEDRVKWRLYHEQNGQCAYSQKRIELEQLLAPGYVEIDHVLPYSRSFDNRMSNRVLVHCKENRDKGNQTPHEYLHGTDRWPAFETWVKATIRDRDKRANLLTENFAKRQDDWVQRSLTDTRYAARFFADLVGGSLAFADPKVKQPVRCLAGGVTALARGLWGLGKTREDKALLADDLHHALDAAVIAMLTPGRIKFITEYSQAKETGRVTEILDEDTGEIYEVFRDKPFEFPPPWKGFRKELLARLSENPADEIAALGIPSYDDKSDVRPVLVSRMPQRKVTGAIHAETIRSIREVEGKSIRVTRCKLTDLTKPMIAQLFDREHNEKLYAAIEERMAPYSDEKNKPAGQKAFGDPQNPLRKPTKDGSQGPIVKSVKIRQPQYTGVMVRKGIADNDSNGIVRIDVSVKQNAKGVPKYYSTPVYVSHVLSDNIPDIPGEFLFSLHKYDLVLIERKLDRLFGYYRGYNINTDSLTICEPNNATSLKGSIGVRNAVALIKFEMSVLGDYHPVRKEVRRGLANGGNIESGEAES